MPGRTWRLFFCSGLIPSDALRRYLLGVLVVLPLPLDVASRMESLSGGVAEVEADDIAYGARVRKFRGRLCSCMLIFSDDGACIDGSSHRA